MYINFPAKKQEKQEEQEYTRRERNLLPVQPKKGEAEAWSCKIDEYRIKRITLDWQKTVQFKVISLGIVH